MASASDISPFQPHLAAQLMPIKLTVDNYSLWKSLLVPTLMQHDMLNMVQGTDQRSPSLKDQKCMDFIKLTLSEAMLPHAVGCSTPRSLWLKLEAQGEIARTRIFEMTCRLANLKKASSASVSTYYKSAKKIADRLAAAGSPVTNGDFVKHVLMGLTDEFDKVSNTIRARSDTLTPEELHDLLVVEETEGKYRLSRQVTKYGVVGVVLTVVYLVGHYRGWHAAFDCIKR